MTKEIASLEDIDRIAIEKSGIYRIKAPKYTEKFVKYEGIENREEENGITVISLGKQEYENYLKKLNLKYEEVKDKAILMGLKTALIAGIKFRVDFNEDGNLYTKKIFKSKKKDGMMKLTQNIINEQNKYQYDPKIAVVGTVKERYVLIDDIITYLEDLHYFDKIIRKDINGIVAAYGSEDLCGISLVKKYTN